MGTQWEILNIQLKPYASTRYAHAAVDGLLELKPKFKVEELQQIDVYLYKNGLGLLNKTHPKTMLDLQFSLPHIFGLLLLEESLIILNKAYISNEAAIAISKKVNLHLDDNMKLYS